MGLCEELAGLFLKASKCKVVPLWAPLGFIDVRAFRGLISEVAPSWVSLDMVESSVYLGILLGPAAT
eukprot:4760340-Pyramimonas_sp.AAC.1